MKQRKVKIEIGGSTYKILTDLTDEELRWIENYINSKLHEIQKQAFFQLDLERSYLYTALNLAEDLYRLQKKLESIRAEIAGLSRLISKHLESDEKAKELKKEND